MITEKERLSAVERLTRSRVVLLEAVDGVSELQARWRPSADRWSILEFVEHLAISDDSLIALVEKSLKTPAKTETVEERKAREKKIRETPMPPGVNRAPERLQPNERFASLGEAVTAFVAARDRTLEYARTTEHELRSHFESHPILGPLDAYQWMVANAHHAESHAGHIRDIRNLPDFPKA